MNSSGGVGNKKENDDEEDNRPDHKPFSKIHYKLAKLNSQVDENLVPQPTPPTSHDIVSASAQSSESQTSSSDDKEPKKHKMTSPDEVFSPLLPSPEFRPRKPTQSQGSAPPLRIRVIGPTPPASPQPGKAVLLSPDQTSSSDDKEPKHHKMTSPDEVFSPLLPSPEFRPRKPTQSQGSAPPLRIRVIGPTPPASPQPGKPVLLSPDQTTYLRPKRQTPSPRPSSNSSGSDLPPMGPPAQRLVLSPHAMIRKAVADLKKELKLESFAPSPELKDLEPLISASDSSIPAKSYSVQYHAASSSSSIGGTIPVPNPSVEDVIFELDEFLDRIPETASSAEMKERLVELQTKLGLPERPAFYNLLYSSELDFMDYLATHFVFDSISDDEEDDGEDEEKNDDTGGGGGGGNRS